MQNIIFEEIELQNFLTFGKNPVKLKIQSGLNFITGTDFDKDSKNGVGKSTLILESLSFLLFGETFRDINNALIPHNGTDDTCYVRGSFYINDDHYDITRTLNPSRLFLKKNGNSITKTIPELNKDIIKILGIHKDIFRNTIVMTNRGSPPFFEQKNDAKNKFIEGILSLDVFSRMYDDIKSLYNEKNKEYIKLDVQLKELRKSVETDEQYATRERIKHSELVEQLIKKITKIKTEQIIDAQPEIDANNNQLVVSSDKLEKAKDKLNQAKLKEAGFNSEYKQKNAELANLSNKKFECPTCKRPYDDCSDKHIIEDQKTKLKEDLVEIKGKLNKFSQIIIDINTKIREYSDNISILNNANRKLTETLTLFNRNKNELENLEKQLENLKEWINPFDDKIEQSKSRLAALSKDADFLKKYLRILEGAKHVASPSGVKPFVTKKIIDLFNDRLNYYLALLKAPCRIIIDEFFQEKFIEPDGQERSYGNYSGGEAKRIDFALLFTFRDIRRLQSNISINISVFDELFDGALERVAIETIVELLKETADKTGEAFYVISHRSDAIDHSICNVINLEKRKGITRIVEK